MKSPFNNGVQAAAGAYSSPRYMACFALLLLSVAPLRAVGPWAALWAAPAILAAAMVIAWGAESAQYFIAQGFALAILAWLQTLPEFGVEAVLALKQQVPFLLANLTGALRLLVGFGWPMIYATAAYAHRKARSTPLKRIALHPLHSVNVVGLLIPLLYVARIWWKASLDVFDAAVLIAIYAAYLAILSRMPAEEEGEEDLEAVPRAIVNMPRLQRIAAISGLFVVGGALIFFSSEPFVGSLLAISTTLGIPPFIFIQWVAPFVSEFPEMVSTFYFARTIRQAPMALMNMVSSNINQWTLLTAMLPILYSFSTGRVSSIPFDPQQRLEILMTLGQSLVAMLFLINMELAWWEASALFSLFIVQFGLSAVPPREGVIGYLALHVHGWVTMAYFVWAAVEIVRMMVGRRTPLAFIEFGRTWRKHVTRSA